MRLSGIQRPYLDMKPCALAPVERSNPYLNQ
jgi:hypothetical protein